MPFGDRTDRLATIHVAHRLNVDEPGWGDTEISYHDLLDFRGASSVEGIGGYLTRSFLLSGDGAGAERVRGGSVTPDLFPLLGIEPDRSGRQFRLDEAAAPGLESVVMITHGLWQRRYGGDPAIIGKPIIVNDRPRVVIGVMPPGFRFPEFDELYLPLPLGRVAAIGAQRQCGRPAAAGADRIERARAELASVAKRLEETYPETNRGYGVRVIPIRDSYIGTDDRRLTVVLMSAVGFVLLIMCANLANLMLVRGAARQRELAVRSAMGASRGRLLWTTLSETVLLAAPGAALGLLLSQWLVDVMIGAFPPSGRCRTGSTSASTVACCCSAIGAAVFTTLVVGLLPALRTVRPNLVNDLKDGGRGVSLGRGRAAAAGRTGGRAGGAVLRVAGWRQPDGAEFPRHAAHQPGLRSIARSSTAAGYLAGDAYDELSARARRSIVSSSTRCARCPGVAAAAVTTSIPGDDGGDGQQLVIDGRTDVGGRDWRSVDRHQPGIVRHDRRVVDSRAAPSRIAEMHDPQTRTSP